MVPQFVPGLWNSFNLHPHQPYLRHLEKVMRIRSTSYVAIIVVAAAASVTSIPAYSQSDAMSASAASPAPTKKQLRTQNRALEKAVRKSFSKVQGLDSSGIFIIPHSGNVTLEGDVTEASQIDIAGHAAAATPGVTHVNNKITIRYPGD
jgi:hyperosmotically inducible protein